MNNNYKAVNRFDKAVLDQLNEDELSLLYLLYYKLFDRTIDLRSVFVEPVLARIKNAKHLNEEGVKVRDSIVNKIESYYNLSS